MPKLSNKELKQWLETQISKFQSLMGKEITVQFSIHSFTTKILGIKIARQADMTNKPKMRAGDDGKQYTPSCLHVQCEGGDLFFIIEDIQIFKTLDSVLVVVEDSVTVSFTDGIQE